MVLVHGSDPLAYGGAGLGDLGDGQWREVFVVYVRLDLGNHLIWNMVLIKFEQAFEELGRVLQQCLARLPVVIHLGPHLLSSHLLCLDVLHDAHGLHHKLDPKRRPLERTHLHHIIPV